ncbi:unnamed protein product [Zymoseptoria tritici ST99CH_1A5]|uniref:Replication factor A protein 3 n=5 Tax=Zymoseptoria TaxID=1047167 RepID=F9X3W2_ZYMTI|nr:uncharacterized protein MYCGRDRAFT_108196 [Zymoseptoria tritici IPO323]KJX98078.1 putative dna replication factor a subunit ssb3 protein [Zymoseptoria brevis]SMQ47914.1 unnamed protein product [Zymoseptoria tritici ST99CH_3D7]SMR46449.1 unnamed protein product [Zymoseptoria tritici ST99CH_1E4]SMR47697.1 unnamed protein product [Zymoseptoria tritici ST99CH_3D1]SMY21601.1 unnamed protein product [Zymoseptoria tritici ST99CH_1A5]
MSEATPRITAPYLGEFSHRTVRVVGKVSQLRGMEATIDSGGDIIVHLNMDSHLHVGNTFEFIGKVGQDLSLKVMASTDMGPNVDFSAYEALVDATHRYSEIFYDKN